MSYDVSGLAIGTYEAEITVTSPEAGNSPQVVPVTLIVEAFGPDADGDGDVDLEDFGQFQACMNGAGMSVGANCLRFDLDDDTDVDVLDFGVFVDCISGANVPAALDCDD